MKANEPSGGAAITPGETGPLAGVHRFSHAAMATLFEIRCVHADPGYASQAAQAAFQLVDRLEQEQSRFVANSDVSRINHLSAGQATRVSPSTMECLEIARRMYDLTGGAFDISVGSGLDGLDLVPEDFTVVARTGGVRLDLGGIAKGYAVDRVAELLEEWEIPRALIHGGWSSVLALEPPPDGDGWILTLSAPEPAEARVLHRIAARQTALSASGTRKGDHILDPRTQRPVRKRAVWVAVAGRDPREPGSPAAFAETLSTAFMVLPPEEVADLCRQCPGVEAWFVEGEGLLHLPASPAGGRREGDSSAD
jgi:thiamine biosynthesis lipoprotein